MAHCQITIQSYSVVLVYIMYADELWTRILCIIVPIKPSSLYVMRLNRIICNLLVYRMKTFQVQPIDENSTSNVSEIRSIFDMFPVKFIYAMIIKRTRMSKVIMKEMYAFAPLCYQVKSMQGQRIPLGRCFLLGFVPISGQKLFGLAIGLWGEAFYGRRLFEWGSPFFFVKLTKIFKINN